MYIDFDTKTIFDAAVSTVSLTELVDDADATFA